MHPSTVSASLYYLRQTDSYLGEPTSRIDNSLDKHREFLDEIIRSRPSDHVIGTYVNNFATMDCLIITNNGILSIYKMKGRFISFDEIKSASVPQIGDQEIDVELADNQYETISVLGQTNGCADIFAFYEFLKLLVRNVNSDVFESLKTVESKEDLVDLMEQHFSKRKSNETRYRFKDFDAELLERDIDPAITRMKGFWRLMGIWRIDDALVHDDDDLWLTDIRKTY